MISRKEDAYMKGKTAKPITIILAAVFTVSLAVVGIRAVQYRQIDKANSEALALAAQSSSVKDEQVPDAEPQESAEIPVVSEQSVQDTVSSAQDTVSSAEDLPEITADPEDASEESAEVYIDPYADELSNMDFTALRQVNSDILGWIMIPDTNISFPLLQTTDNEYYLKHNWRKGYSIGGAIYIECQNASDFSHFNTIIYGHRMSNGTMFAQLARYEDSSFLEDHPSFYITDDSGTHIYDVFAAYEVSKTGTTYRLELNSEQDRQQYIDYCIEQSVCDTGIVPTVDDKIVTLSTCTAYGEENRWVVQGVLRTDSDAQ